MVKNKILILSCLLMIVPLISNFAQGIAISDDIENPHPSSILDISSTNKGLLLPRMTTAQRDAIGSPAESLFIFNIETKCFEIFVEDIWHSLWCAEDIEEPFSCGNTLNYEGYDYQTVQIGTQCWFAENLRYLPSVVGLETESQTIAYYYVYDYEGTNVNDAKATTNYQTYGAIYNWNAASTACPPGWSLPSETDWTSLEIYLGMDPSETDEIQWRNSGDVGDKLKAVSFGGNNSTGFTAIPGGVKTTSPGEFVNIDVWGGFWTSTGGWPWIRALEISESGVYRFDFFKDFAMSVRCIKD